MKKENSEDDENYMFALYFILSRDVLILKSFSTRRPKIIACCSYGCSAVTAVAGLSWPTVGCENGRRRQRILQPNLYDNHWLT